MRTLLLTLAAVRLALPAAAQPSSATWNGLPDRFQVDTGYFRLTADSVFTFQGGPATGGVSFERDLGADKRVDTFWVDGTWRLGRRHSVKLGYTRLSRDHDGRTLSRDLNWGGDTYTAGLTASSTTGADVLGGYYRFAAYRSDRFEVGPALGVGYLWLSATIRATGSVGGASRTLDHEATVGSITGALGGYVNAWPAKRLALRGDFLYIKVKPENSEASVTDWRAGADYYFVRNAGLGVQYKYDKYRQDRDVLSSKLGGHIAYKGFQVFASFLF